MSEEIEDALRRELQAQWVPFDEARAEDMVRAAAESGLAGTPRAWVAPLAAAAAVVVVGGGVALATAGGGGNSGAAQPGSPGVGPSTGSNDYAVAPCTPIGSDGAYIVGTASAVPDSMGPLASAMYSAYAEASSAPDLPPVVATYTPVRLPPLTTESPTSAPAATLTGVPAPTASYVPGSVGSSGTIHITPSDAVVICEVGTATAGRVGTVDCSDTKAISRDGGPDGVLVCVATASAVPLDNPPTPPTGTESGPAGVVGTCDANATCERVDVGTATPTSSSSDTTFSINTTVAPGDSRTFDGPAIPAGQVLHVTAMIFQNPAADTGTFTVTGDAQHRLRLQLSNFRDLDEHFENSPITYDADHPLRVTVDCTNSSVDCTPAVLVNGYVTG